MQWYYISGKERLGPIDDEQLGLLARDGVLKPDDYVWNETLGDRWARAASVPGLFGEGRAEPPPVVSTPPPVAAAGAGGTSCTAPVGAAWTRMKQTLFTPFDLGKWFSLGVSAWLASIGSGSGQFNVPDLSAWNRRGRGGAEFERMFEQALAWAKVHLSLVLGVGAAVVLVSVSVSLVLLWLRCRGKFMFLDNLVQGRSEVSEPWREYSREGNSLFAWSVVFGLACAACFLLLGLACVFGVVVPCVAAKRFLPAVIPVVALLGLAFVAFAIVAAYVARYLEDFIVPIMYRQRVTAVEAWRRFAALFRPQAGAFILYGLFYLLLSFVGGFAVLAAVLLSCCTAGCLMAIPYVGAVVLLPVTVFFRFYSVGYLAQFGPEFDAAG